MDSPPRGGHGFDGSGVVTLDLAPGPDRMDDMPLPTHIDEKEAEFGPMIPPELVPGGHGIELRIAGSDEPDGRHHVEVGVSVTAMEEPMDMPREDRLHRIPLNQVEQTGPNRRSEVVVVFLFVGIPQVRGIVAEQEDPFARLAGVEEDTLQPPPLVGLRIPTRPQDGSVQEDEATAFHRERAAAGAPARLERGVVLLDGLRGVDPGEGLVPDVMVSGDDVEGDGEPLICSGRQGVRPIVVSVPGDGMDHVAEVDHEGRSEPIQHLHEMPVAALQECVRGETAWRQVARPYMGVGDDGEPHRGEIRWCWTSRAMASGASMGTKWVTPGSRT